MFLRRKTAGAVLAAAAAVGLATAAALPRQRQRQRQHDQLLRMARVLIPSRAIRP